MMEGDVVLTPIPQADGRVKNRPAIVLREMLPYHDLLVCGVSTQLKQYVKDFDEIISSSGDWLDITQTTQTLIKNSKRLSCW